MIDDNRLLEELKYQMDLKPRINHSQFRNSDFLDGYAFGLRVAMDVIVEMKTK